MKSKMIIAIVFIFLVVAAGLIFYCIKKEPKEGRICLKERCFSVEMASSIKDRARGLMFRESLEKNKGMLFLFRKQGEYSFWMKNVLIPLDIIWLNENKEVVHIAENCQPCPELPCQSIKPDKKAKYVLEINGGLVSKIGIKTGDTAELQYE